MTERSVLEQRTVALAGVAQAARIVDLAAKTVAGPTLCGGLDTSLFSFDPEGVETVFGTPQGIRLGLEQLSACWASPGRSISRHAALYLGHSAAGAPLCRPG